MYILYLITLGGIIAVLFYLANIVSFHVRKQTLVSHVDPKSQFHKELQRRTGIVATIASMVALAVLIMCLSIEVKAIRHRYGASDAKGPLYFGIVLMIIIACVVVYKLAAVAHSNSKPDSSPRAKRKNNSWLA